MEQIYNPKQRNVSCSVRKSIIWEKEDNYLGHVVSRAGIHTDPSKIVKAKQYPISTDVSQVRQFLGLASNYRDDDSLKAFRRLSHPSMPRCVKMFVFSGTIVVSSPLLN